MNPEYHQQPVEKSCYALFSAPSAILASGCVVYQALLCPINARDLARDRLRVFHMLPVMRPVGSLAREC